MMVTQIVLSIFFFVSSNITDYYKPVEKSFMFAGFRVIFVSGKVLDGESPTSRSKILKTKCGDKAYWSSRYPDNITVWLDPECSHEQTVKASFIYGDDIQDWVEKHISSSSTREFDEFVVDVREKSEGVLVLTIKKIDPFEGR